MSADTPCDAFCVSESPEGDEEKVLAELQIQKTQNDVPVTRVRTAQEWEGADDPENPLNWPAWKKVYHITMVGFLCFTM